MKTALLHYWLVNERGGEKVLAALGALLPDADIFTHAYLPERFGEKSRARLWGHQVTESLVARLPGGRRRPQMYLPVMPIAERGLKLDGYGLIVSSESGPIKGVRKPAGARHVCYCHTPMRYLWDMADDYYQAAGWKGKLAMKLFLDYLRKEDLKSAESVDEFVANSNFVAERIRRIYGRESKVVYPPVEVEYFAQAAKDRAAGDYYLCLGQLNPYKKPDWAVEACHRMGRRLVVAGDGEMLENLKRRGYPEVEFLGRVDGQTIFDLYAHARALIFPGCEDFGIVPVEAQAAGTPVIALKKGGALETVVEGETGLFFDGGEPGDEAQIAALCQAIEEFEGRKWSAETCTANARRFGRQRFMKAMSSILCT